MAPDRNGHLILFATQTWKWAGSSWTQLHPAHQPGPRYFPAMVYDALHGQSVLFGGRDPFTQAFLADTWIWNGSDWKLKSPSASPPARYLHSMAYDGAEQRVVMFGGYNSSGGPGIIPALGDTWEWDSAAWVQRQPITSPPGRDHAVMAYDRLRGRVVLFGGLPDNGCGTE